MSICHHEICAENRGVELRCLFKISLTSNEVYDILKPALTSQDWQCQGWGDFYSRPTTKSIHKRILRMPKNIIPKKQNKNNNFFLYNYNLRPKPHQQILLPAGTVGFLLGVFALTDG